MQTCFMRRMDQLKLVATAFVCIVVVAGMSGSLQAEVYKWQDENGVIRYSNYPPKDPSRLLEQLVPATIPQVQSPEGTMYYFSLPEQIPLRERPDPISLSPEKIEEILKTPEVKASPSPSAVEVDLAMVLTRLEQVENALQYEIMNRLKLEHESAKSRTMTDDLAHQNRVLRQTVAHVELELNRLQQTVAIAQADRLQALEEQMTALRTTLPTSQPTKTAKKTTAQTGPAAKRTVSAVSRVQKKEQSQQVEQIVAAWLKKMTVNH